MTENELLKKKIDEFLEFCKKEKPDGVEAQLDFKCTSCDISKNEVTYAYTPKPCDLNVHNAIHGGKVAALFDSCFGITGMALKNNASVTVDISVTYMKAASINKVLTVRTHLVHSGKTTEFLSGEILDGDTVCYTSQTVLHVVGSKMPSAE